MGVGLTRLEGQPSSESEVERRLADEGLSARTWGNGPHDRYAAHRHGYHKVLYCLSGSIVFHVEGDDLELRPGDRLDVEAGTEHAATVGAEGVRCIEAARPPSADRQPPEGL
ncbi:MAG TPA: cupin domain-containing protein [Acidimicrobiales bacterium]|nr:cupin domain-containing protein [Acidimicrobiales bacterium]